MIPFLTMLSLATAACPPHAEGFTFAGLMPISNGASQVSALWGATSTRTCSIYKWRRSSGPPWPLLWRRFSSCPSCGGSAVRLLAGRKPAARKGLVLQRGDVSRVLAQFLGLQHPPHDLARAGLGQRRDDFDFLRDRDLPQLVLDVILCQERLDRLAGRLVRLASIAPSSQMLCLRVSGMTKTAIRNITAGT